MNHIHINMDIKYLVHKKYFSKTIMVHIVIILPDFLDNADNELLNVQYNQIWLLPISLRKGDYNF